MMMMMVMMVTRWTWMWKIVGRRCCWVGGRCARTHATATAATYGKKKVANREIRVWHGATESGP
jgi:hypothetical protein